jgi:hypothetical protein
MKVNEEAYKKLIALFLNNLQFSLFMSVKSDLLVFLVRLDFTVKYTLITRQFESLLEFSFDSADNFNWLISMATLRHAILMFLTPFSPVSQLPLL